MSLQLAAKERVQKKTADISFPCIEMYLCQMINLRGWKNQQKNLYKSELWWCTIIYTWISQKPPWDSLCLYTILEPPKHWVYCVAPGREEHVALPEFETCDVKEMLKEMLSLFFVCQNVLFRLQSCFNWNIIQRSESIMSFRSKCLDHLSLYMQLCFEKLVNLQNSNQKWWAVLVTNKGRLPKPLDPLKGRSTGAPCLGQRPYPNVPLRLRPPGPHGENQIVTSGRI